MNRFASACIAAAALVALTGCQSGGFIDKLESAYTTATQSGIAPEAIATSISTFDAIKVTATNYTRLPRCTGSNGPFCRDPALRVRIKQAIASGTVARNNLKAFLRLHPTSLGDQGLYDTLTSATKTIEDATAAYRAAGGN